MCENNDKLPWYWVIALLLNALVAVGESCLVMTPIASLIHLECDSILGNLITLLMIVIFYFINIYAVGAVYMLIQKIRGK